MKLFQNNKDKVILIVILLIIPIVINVLIENYEYNKCVRINKEELRRCDSEYKDCSVYENSEKICNEVKNRL